MDDMWGFYRWLPFLNFDFFYVVVGYLWEELSVKRSRAKCTVEALALIGVVLTPLPAVCASKVREERRYEKIQPIT